ncbi:MAG: lipoate--protein ligase [Clostridia bacterium]|nr:lipoate--protein ligase [Clostridia bacterium]
MKYLRLTSTDPYYNLAVEEFLFRHTEEDFFLLWQNEPTVVIGKNQNAYAEEHGIHVCRRITGGGAVYHDLGNINYSVISSNASSLNYACFAAPILEAVSSLGLPCALNGRNDLEIGGRKFSGNAQYTVGGRTLHHGTLLFDTELSRMSEVLRVDKEKLAYKAVKSASARVVNLSELLDPSQALEEFMNHLEQYILANTGATCACPPVDERIERLRARNASPEWIFSDKRYLTEYSIARKKKYPFGLVSLDINMEKDQIRALRITGDFFGSLPIEELERCFIGHRLGDLPPIDPSPYISGMSSSELRALLLTQ